MQFFTNTIVIKRGRATAATQTQPADLKQKTPCHTSSPYFAPLYLPVYNRRGRKDTRLTAYSSILPNPVLEKFFTPGKRTRVRHSYKTRPETCLFGR